MPARHRPNPRTLETVYRVYRVPESLRQVAKLLAIKPSAISGCDRVSAGSEKLLADFNLVGSNRIVKDLRIG